MLIRLPMIGAALLANISCAAAREEIKTPAKVDVEGVISFGREASISDYKINLRGLAATPGSCINGIFKDPDGKESNKIELDGKRVIVSGSLVRYLDYYSADPLVATISSLQNSCGNDYFIIISRVRISK